MSRKTLRVLSSSFLSSFFSLPPFTSFSPFSIVFLYILPFREKCCKSFPKKGVLRRRQRGARRNSQADAWPLCPPQLCQSTLKSHPYSLMPLHSPLLPTFPLHLRLSATLSFLWASCFLQFLPTFDFFLIGGKYTGLVMRTHFMECQTRISCRISGDPP